MIKRIVGWFVLVPLCAALVVFALANRHMVSVSLDPLSSSDAFLPAFQVPLFIVIYLMLLLGIVLGGVAVWFTQGHNRREKRQLKRENERLGKELDTARQAVRQTANDRGLLAPDDLLDVD